MPLWRITPIADPDDSRWLDHQRWEEVVVAAQSAGRALHLAAEMESRAAPEGVGNESVPFKSGFEDEKLYRIDRLSESEAGEYDGDEAEERIIEARAPAA